MKKQLLILSDLWGTQKAAYLPHYIQQLQPKYDLEFLDCCEIGRVNTIPYLQENLHQQFVNGGINNAVEYLLENYQEEVNLLAFSIGGTIAWKANLAGLKVQNLWAVSATRLRYEIEKPNSQISLIYGGLDTYRPDGNWFKNLVISDYQIIEEEGHELYRKPKIISSICKIILSKSLS